MLSRQTLKIVFASVATVALATAAATTDTADRYPSKPIKIVVPFPPGSPSDDGARLYARALQDEFRQTVVVENRGGAGGAIGLQAVMQAPADGYTLAMGGAFLLVNPIVMKSPGAVPSDFLPLYSMWQNPMGIYVGGESRLKTFADLIAAAKKEGGVSFGAYTATFRLGAELLGQVSGTTIRYVPYKGAGQIINDLKGGALDAALLPAYSNAGLVRQGVLRLLATTGDKREPEFPQVPMVKEIYPRYGSLATWGALIVRADTPPNVLARLAAAMRRFKSDPELRDLVAKGGTPHTVPTAQLPKFQADEYERYKGIAKAANIHPE